MKNQLFQLTNADFDNTKFYDSKTLDFSVWLWPGELIPRTKPHPLFDIICPTINFSSFLTDANIDATYNRTPLEPKPWFPVDKPNLTLYN